MKNHYLEKRLKIVKNISDELRQFNNIKMVAVTGSCAIGCPTDKSDIDLQVAFGEMPDSAEIEKIKNCLLDKYGQCKQHKWIGSEMTFGITIEDVNISVFYGIADDFKSVAFCGKNIGTDGESSLSVYYDMLPFYDSMDICGYILNNFEYTDEKQKEILSAKINNLKDLFKYEALKILGNNIMFLKYKHEIIENIIDIIYSLNNRPKRMINDFIFMGDRLNFYPLYLLTDLSSLAFENNTDVFNKQAKELIVKILNDSSNDILKANSTIFTN